MTDRYRTLRVARTDEGVVRVVIDAPPMNLIGPELVRDFVALLSELAAGEGVRVMVSPGCWRRDARALGAPVQTPGGAPSSWAAHGVRTVGCVSSASCG